MIRGSAPARRVHFDENHPWFSPYGQTPSAQIRSRRICLRSPQRQFCREQNWAALATPTGLRQGRCGSKRTKRKGAPRLGPCGTSLCFSPQSGEPDGPSMTRRARAGIRTGTWRALPPSAAMLGCVERVFKTTLLTSLRWVAESRLRDVKSR